MYIYIYTVVQKSYPEHSCQRFLVNHCSPGYELPLQSKTVNQTKVPDPSASKGDPAQRFHCVAANNNTPAPGVFTQYAFSPLEPLRSRRRERGNQCKNEVVTKTKEINGPSVTKREAPPVGPVTRPFVST